ncbi:MAG: hypothetical protein H7257_07270 [Taibaiella sp.]|nr:hypothetical protein [Taibaiella sp.]
MDTIKFTDIGPATSPPATQNRKQRSNHSSAPPAADCQSPPSFFEKGNRSRWLIPLLPLALSAYYYREISPFQLLYEHYLLFYLFFFACCALTTYFALNAKRNALRHIFHDTYDNPCYLHAVAKAYNHPLNTLLVPAICTATAFTEMVCRIFSEQPAGLQATITLATALFFLVIFRANNYKRVYSAYHGIEPPYHPQNLTTAKRKTLQKAGSAGLSITWIYDNLVAAGMLDETNGT